MRRENKYRVNLIHRFREACGHQYNADELIEKFVRVTKTLKILDAFALHIADGKGVVRNDITEVKYENVDDLIDSPSISHVLLHPLSIALLAFRMGGVINAADTSHLHEWKPHTAAMTDAHNFHMKGASNDVFDDPRITTV